MPRPSGPPYVPPRGEDGIPIYPDGWVPDTINEAMLAQAWQMARLRRITSDIHKAEKAAMFARAVAEAAESQAFIDAEGAMDIRKHLARVDPEVVRLKKEADDATAQFRALERAGRGCVKQIDVYITQGSTLKAELAAGLVDAPDTWQQS
jgi:ABC-type uncharacterized transport system YnjBCD substrate-binding protein